MLHLRRGIPYRNPDNEASRYRSVLGDHSGLLLSSPRDVRAGDPSPTPQTTGQPGVTIEEVVVTGSNIPTSEEVGPNPVDTYRREDITRLGVRSATDLIQKLPAATGSAINENVASAVTAA